MNKRCSCTSSLFRRKSCLMCKNEFPAYCKLQNHQRIVHAARNPGLFHVKRAEAPRNGTCR